MLNTYTRGYSVSKKFLSVALFLVIISSANALSSGNYQNVKDVSRGNVTNAPSDSVAVYNATSRDGNERQGRLFFGLKSRTLLGARRRITFALLPIMYKLGVISTMLVGLTVMVLKGLTIGVILLFFALGNAFLKAKHHPSPQPVHFHLHPSDFHPKPPIYHGYEHSGPWDKASEDEDAQSYENYNPSYSGKLHIVRHPYRYSHRDYYPYHGR